MQESQGSNNQMKEIAYDLLIDSKFSIASIAKAATEATNTQLRIFLNEAMTESIQGHFMLSDILVSQNLYQPLNVQQQLQNDLSESQRLTQQSQRKNQSSNSQQRSASQGYEEFASEMNADSSNYSSSNYDDSNQSNHSGLTAATSQAPQSSSFDQSSVVRDTSYAATNTQSENMGYTPQNGTNQLQSNQSHQGQSLSSQSLNNQSQRSSSLMSEEYSSELQAGQKSSTTQQSQKQSPPLPYTTALAPHEVLELHELVRTDAICLKKLEMSVNMVQDFDLKSLMQNASQQKRQFLNDSETFFQRSSYTDIH